MMASSGCQTSRLNFAGVVDFQKRSRMWPAEPQAGEKKKAGHRTNPNALTGLGLGASHAMM